MTLVIPRNKVESTKAFCWSKDWLPYAWGGSGNPGGDCSWFTGAVAADLQGMKTTVRYGYTGSFYHPGRTGMVASPEAAMLGLSRAANKASVPADAVLKLGFYHSSNPGNAHTSGTVDGLNFESRGMWNGRSGHVIGSAARAWNHSLYNDWWYLDSRIGAGDPNAFPLPSGWYYGPRSGPTESVSGEAGEPQHQIHGILRMQSKLGLPLTGRWIDARTAVIEVQRTDPSLTPDGTVGPRTWALIMGISAQPPANLIDIEATVAADWIGKRLFASERVCLDGIGRFVEFTDGAIYWHPDTGAVAIPTHIYETWRDLGWEQGPLGYPTRRHTVVEAGDVQAFEGGIVYRRYGHPGYYVTGVIGDRWYREGAENGPLGWPVSNEQDYKGGRAQRFQAGGSLIWHASGAPEADLVEE